MKKYFFLISILLFSNQGTYGQGAFYHKGSLHLGPDAQLGLHIPWINDAALEEGFGRVGFYGNQLLEVSGSFPPVLFDVEIFNPAGVDLSVTIFVRNSLSFFDGDLRTPRTDLSISSFFEGLAFIQGASDDSKIDGQVSFDGQLQFRAPVGTSDRLRIVDFNFEDIPSRGSCTYMAEDPNFPISLAESFNTASMAPTLDAVSNTEFWLFSANNPAIITINWDRNSRLSTLTDQSEAITLVGWNPVLSQWTPVPVQSRVGGLDEGFITTQAFTPNQFSAYTFGILDQPDEILELGNYFLSPNGDGINDRLVIEELEQSPNNRVVIFNRAGLKVFEFDNYTNQFEGNANSGSTFYGIDLGLPEGIYFYIARLDDLNLNFQGFIFLDR